MKYIDKIFMLMGYSHTETMIKSLKKLRRYNHEFADGGDGYIDDWKEPDEKGVYVLHEDLSACIKQMEKQL